MPPPTPYPQLNVVLQELVTSIQAILGETFVAACLQGSFAVGDFDRDSDADFVIVIKQELSDEQVRALQIMHERVYNLDCAWAQHLEGSYFPKDVLRHADRRNQPLWYLDHGSRSLIRSTHCNTLIVRLVVREHGVALAGSDPAALVDPIPVELLRQEIRGVMHDWWQSIRANPEQLNNRFYQTYAVLNYCRMLHDLVTGTVGSKRAGAEWAKATFDPRWAELIDRAWQGRPDPALSSRQPADPADLQLTLAFIEYIMSVAALNE
ncbi:MAG: aminoglycoside adenylyltransferase domain-containing protein [Roseiflexaceae bacterium]